MSSRPKDWSARPWIVIFTFIVLVAGVLAVPLDPDHEPTINLARSLFSEGQWVSITIRNEAYSGDMHIRNLRLDWGKWYAHPDKGHELSDNDVQGGFAGPNGGTVSIAASGRSWTPTGTEGHFDIYHGGVKVCNIYFDCPFSHIHNNFEISEVNDQYAVQATGQSLDGGALGDITIKVVKIHDEQGHGRYGKYGWEYKSWY